MIIIVEYVDDDDDDDDDDDERYSKIEMLAILRFPYLLFNQSYASFDYGIRLT